MDKGNSHTQWNTSHRYEKYEMTAIHYWLEEDGILMREVSWRGGILLMCSV